jgi:hypothetical protein
MPTPPDRAQPSFLRSVRTPLVLALVIASTTVMSLACDGTVDAPPRGSTLPTDPAAPKDPTAPQGNGDPYDPAAPSNQGPAVNPDGFAAIKPIVERHCAECHHAGTPLDLAAGIDAATAAKVSKTLAEGSMPPAPRAKLTPEEIAKVEAWRSGSPGQAPAPAPAPANVAVRQILDGATLASYKAALPKVAWPRLTQILESPSTLFYDKRVMPGAYQDTVGTGGNFPFGARLNNSGKNLIVPAGKKLFSDDGTTWAFPFGHTAGTDDTPNVVVSNFITLPADANKLLPVAYRIEQTQQAGFPNTRWNWSFPVGTIVGEVLMVRDGTSLRTTEIRTRERFKDAWATNVFRPFPTAGILAAAVKARRADWQAVPALATLVTSLEDMTTLSPKRLGSPAFNDMVVLQGSVDAALPAIGDDALTRDLLTTTPFVSAYGTAWKASGAAKAFGPTGPASGLSVVPARFDSGLLEVRESTCSKCHDQGGWFIGSLVDDAVLYGDIWGVDRVFSFYPFDPSRIEASGNENRVVRPAFAQGGVFERYDAAKHAAERYTFYKPQP